MIKLIKCKDKKEVAVQASKFYINTLRQNPCSVLGLATGSTPLGLYEELIRLYLTGIISFSQVTTFNLDEYLGLPDLHSQTYRNFMDKNLFNHIDIGKLSSFFPANRDYDDVIDMIGGIDLQLLGIGRNGHIGFNEPGTSKDSLTHVVNLTEGTIKDNARFFEDISQVPKKAITMGITSILNTKKIILLATGGNKAKAVFNAIKMIPNNSCPASFLQSHPNCTFIIDKEAGGLL